MAEDADQRGDQAEEHPAGEAPGRPRTVAAPRPFDADPAEVAEAEPGEPEAGDDEPQPAIVDTPAVPEPSEPFEDLSQLPALIEALLFVADHPIEESYLARALEVSQPRVIRALDELAESLREGGRGIRLQRGPEGAQLVSAPEAAPHVERFLGLEANRRLSTAALETLAIIAYRQPITRGQIDAVRGVSSDGAIQTLRARGLIESAGHAAGPGRPMLLRTTQRFLEHFGLERPGQLPPLPEDVDLPPSEISAQLGLDEAIVEEALAQARAEPDEPAGGEPGAPREEAVDELPVAEAEEEAETDDVDIPADLEALTQAAGQALAHLARDEAGGDADGEERRPEGH